MNYFNNAPFIRILPAFCTGIVFSFYSVINYTVAGILLCFAIACLVYLFSKKKQDFSQRKYTGISFQIIFFFMGFASSEVRDERLYSNYFFTGPERTIYIGEVDDSPKVNQGKCRAVVIINGKLGVGKYSRLIGKCYLYFKDDSLAEKLIPGDRIIFNSELMRINPPLNPGQFDFQYRSSIHRIYFTAHAGNNDWKKLPTDVNINLKRIATNYRNELLSTYKNAGLSGQEYAVLSALVLGYEDDLDSETLKAFSASGTLHVLSVSGMHVGIIFSALSFLLVFLGKRKSTRIIRLIILLFSLWFYAMLTGLSPSVIRSAMMFSFILIGKSLNRSSNIYNSLSLSAFCIFLFFDPLMLLEVGLQLSFLAVAGIAYLYPKIYKLIFCKNSFIDKIWALVAVSIAAQVATFALSIFYFHQFPNYFIPANLLIIPLSTIGIFGGIILLFVAPFQFLLVKCGYILYWEIRILNASAVFIENVPGAVWQGIVINLFELALIYILFFSIVLFLERRSIMYLRMALFSSIILLCSFGITSYNLLRQNRIIVFSNSSALCLQRCNGYESTVFYHSIDSVKAINYSNSFCLSEGLSLNKQQLINLDDSTCKVSSRDFFINGNYLLIENFLILDLSVKKKKRFSRTIKVDLAFANKYSLKEIIDSEIIPGKILLNRRSNFKLPGENIFLKKINIDFLEDGYKEIIL